MKTHAWRALFAGCGVWRAACQLPADAVAGVSAPRLRLVGLAYGTPRTYSGTVTCDSTVGVSEILAPPFPS
jgi:hypothetical protein